MEIERIFGLVFSGFACRIYASGFALYLASEVVPFITKTFGAMSLGLGQ